VKSVVSGFKATFVAGLVVTVPAVATFLTLRFLLQALDGLLAPAVTAAFGVHVPGLGALSTVAIILAAGLLARSYLGRRLVALGDRAVARVPVVRSIYKATREIVETAALSQRQVFRDVVVLQYPRPGVFSYGFVTAYTSGIGPGEGPRSLANVFIPGPPVPTTGALVVVPVDQLTYLDMPVEDALKLVLSGGMVAPTRLKTRPGPSEPERPAEPNV